MSQKTPDWQHEPAPQLINTLKPVLWPAAALQEIESLVCRLRATHGQVSDGLLRLQVERDLVGRYAQLFVLQVFVRVMKTPLQQQKPPVPNEAQVEAMCSAALLFANNSELMRSALIETAKELKQMALAAALEVKNG